MSFAAWLALREPADAAARSRELVGHLPPEGPHVIHDLGCGTGAMGRWLAPLLPGPQHWVLHDRDAALLQVADVPRVTVETRLSDITRLRADDLAGASLVTASALLDVLTEAAVQRLVAACVGAGCPALLTLSVAGRVDLTPSEPVDRRVAAAFDAHQRRGRLLGPDAVAATAEAFRRSGAEVVARPSPWRLGAAQADLIAAWFTGWVGAACEQDAELAAETGAYARRRLAQAAAGRLAVTVDHVDLLVLPQVVSNRGESA
jgi:hypothetical protein